MNEHPKQRAWRPLFAKAQAEAIRSAVTDIAAQLRKPTPDWFPHRKIFEAAGQPNRRGHEASLANGLAGVALLHAYLFLAEGRRADANTCLTLLNEALETAMSEPMSPDLFGGVAGVAWAATHIQSELAPEDDDAIDNIDELLVEYLGHQSWRGEYDLVRGLVGFGVYALERLPRPAAATCLELVITHLERQTERGPHGLTWRTPPESLTEEERGLAPEGYYNLGIAHGVPGVIALLGAVMAAEIAVERARDLLDGATGWLLQQPFLQRPAHAFPYWFAPGGAEKEPARLGWCYGAPGIAASLLYAARCANDSDWEAEAMRIVQMVTEVPPEKSRIVDAGLCHGSAGLAHLLNRVYQATGDEKAAAAARFWFEHTLSLRQSDAGLAGFTTYLPVADPEEPYVPDAGLLMGAAGIGLAFMAATTSVEPAWDRILLVATPPRPF